MLHQSSPDLAPEKLLARVIVLLDGTSFCGMNSPPRFRSHGKVFVKEDLERNLQPFLGQVTSFGPENYFLVELYPSRGDPKRAVLPRANCLPKDAFVPGERVYAMLIGYDEIGQAIATRNDPALPYHVITKEVPEVASGDIRILGYASIPGEVTTLVLAPGSPGFNAMGAFIGRRERQ